MSSLPVSRRPLRFLPGFAAFFLCMGFFATPAQAVETLELHIIQTERGIEFDPAVLEVPANTKLKLLVTNDTDAAEEFESHDFNREKVIRAGGQATIFLPPLKPGEYSFYGEFHPDTAQGKVVVK